jgi:LAO/AO transport system kinase
MSFAIQKILRGDRKSIALAISEAEDFPQRAAESAKSILQHTGNAHVIGITGPPGSGKSSLAAKLALEFCKKNSKVAILAIDPTSRTSGGAFMGNRVRMQEAYDNKRIYIRSMA